MFLDLTAVSSIYMHMRAVMCPMRHGDESRADDTVPAGICNHDVGCLRTSMQWWQHSLDTAHARNSNVPSATGMLSNATFMWVQH